MEGFQYVDIFSTKGIEYIIVLAFLGILIFFWKWLNKPTEKQLIPAMVKEGKSLSLIDWFYLADNYFYHQGHSWVVPENNNFVKIGIDDFAQKFLGKANKINLPKVGDEIVQGEKGFQIEIDSKYIDILSPVDGKVLEINKQIEDSPHLINKDPYKDGWLLKVQAPKFNINKTNLLSGNLAKKWIEDTVDKISRLMTSDYGVVLQDGGIPVTGFAKEISPDNWEILTSEFLLTEIK